MNVFFAITLTLTILNPFMVKEEKQTFIHPNLTYYLADPAYSNGQNNGSDYDYTKSIKYVEQDNDNVIKPNSIIIDPGLIRPDPPFGGDNPPVYSGPKSFYEGDLNVPYFGQQKFLTDYYSNLNENFPRNVVNSCGYVAISMFISYFDNYWNDDFIQDSCETSGLVELDDTGDRDFESPGLFDHVAEGNYSNWVGTPDNYRIYILDSYYDGSFTGYLYSIAYREGILDFYSDNVGLGVTYPIMVNLLNAYIEHNYLLRDEIFLKTNQLTINGSNGQTIVGEDDLKEEIIEYIQNGYPVIVGGAASGGGHVAVAYEYDENSDIIYCHAGWDGWTHSELDEVFTNGITDYFTFQFSNDLYHTHKNQFYLKDNNSTVCNCQLDTHECTDYCAAYADTGYHAKFCICSDKVSYEKHNFYVDSFGDYICTLCHGKYSDIDREYT